MLENRTRKPALYGRLMLLHTAELPNRRFESGRVIGQLQDTSLCHDQLANLQPQFEILLRPSPAVEGDRPCVGIYVGNFEDALITLL